MNHGDLIYDNSPSKLMVRVRQELLIESNRRNASSDFKAHLQGRGRPTAGLPQAGTCAVTSFSSQIIRSATPGPQRVQVSNWDYTVLEIEGRKALLY